MQCLNHLRPARLLHGPAQRWRIPSPKQHSPTISSASDRSRDRTLLQARAFHSSPQSLAGKKGQRVKPDKRVVMIRYHLCHPLTPRPLRFSRTRTLRHWTIHRAYQLFRAKQRQSREMDLERQFNSMRQACEALRLTGEDGLSITEPGNAIPPPGARDPAFIKYERIPGKTDTEESIDIRAWAQRQREVGRLYGTAMQKTAIKEGFPIEYARAQTETPPKTGWDHAWTR